MDFLRDLEPLIRAQDDSSSSVAEVLAKLGTPSTSIALLDHGTITTQCYSTLNHTPETVFQACSISKPVAGLGVMKLVSQGKLDLDTPITEYLPPSSIEMISTPPTRELLKYVTLKQLLSHTSGLSQGGFPGYPSNPVDLHGVLSGKPPCNTLPVHLDGLPGQTFSYSGGGMSVIQLIIETITSRPFPEIMQDLVFNPLDMTRSFYHLPSNEHDYAKAYYNGFVPCEFPYHILPELVAAGLWTTPTDLLKLVRAIQDSLNPSSDNTFLPQDLAQKMLKEISSSMALSWFAPAAPGIAFYHTGGNEPGFRCFVMGYADIYQNGTLNKNAEKSGLCIMTNSRGGDRVYMKLVHAIMFLKKWQTLPGSLLFNVRSIPFYAADKKISKKWVEWKGEWGDGKWRIEEHERDVCIVFEKLPPVRLQAVAMPETEGEACLRPEGLEKVFHLTEEKGEKVVEVWHAGSGDVTVLRRGERE
jgi:CubicO group peptidase (beta-lactamase class C family)